MIYDVDTARILARFPVTARDPWTRMRGMIGRRFSADMDAMIFPGCRAIHTLFMSMPIDALFLDRSGRVVKVERNLRPWQLYAGTAAAADTAEFPAGALTGVEPGHRILLNQASDEALQQRMTQQMEESKS